jgi:hypothetical protein
MKVYLVDNGEEYSDWGIDAVFVDVDLADEYAEWNGGNVIIRDTNEVKKLDAGELGYRIVVDYRNNEIVSIFEYEDKFVEEVFEFWSYYRFFANVVAKTEAGALSMALAQIRQRAQTELRILEERKMEWHVVYDELKEVFS